MTGHAMPWNRDLSGQQKEDLKDARELTAKQKKLADKQERMMEQQRKKLNKQQISMLRSRYGASGGGGSTASGAPQSMSDSAGSLFSRITGG